jgi:hypothetical protein
MNWETIEGIGFLERIIGDGQPGRNVHKDEFFLVGKVEERDGSPRSRTMPGMMPILCRLFQALKFLEH